MSSTSSETRPFRLADLGTVVVLAVSLLVEAGQAVVNMWRFNAKCAAPPQWLEAVAERGFAYRVFTTRPWPGTAPDKPVEAGALAAFAGAEETLKEAAHIVLPAGSLRG